MSLKGLRVVFDHATRPRIRVWKNTRRLVGMHSFATHTVLQLLNGAVLVFFIGPHSLVDLLDT